MDDMASIAVQPELQALGGGILRSNNSSFSQRMGKPAFLAVVMPTALQLEHDLVAVPS